MRAKTWVFVAVSLDVYIARSNDELDWLDTANGQITPGEDCGYAAFISNVDTIIMGRGTFDKARSFKEWPYGGIPVTVLSRTLTKAPAGSPSTVTITDQTPFAIVEELSQSGAKKIYVDGGLTIQRFLKVGLIDELIITTIPVLIGGGKRLFGELSSDARLGLVSSASYSFGFVQSHYRRIA
jgi:dihydrofolate reductase